MSVNKSCQSMLTHELLSFLFFSHGFIQIRFNFFLCFCFMRKKFFFIKINSIMFSVSSKSFKISIRCKKYNLFWFFRLIHLFSVKRDVSWLVELQHHDYVDRYLLRHFIIGYIAVYIVDPINVSRLVCYLINSFP